MTEWMTHSVEIVSLLRMFTVYIRLRGIADERDLFTNRSPNVGTWRDAKDKPQSDWRGLERRYDPSSFSPVKLGVPSICERKVKSRGRQRNGRRRRVSREIA